MTLHSPPFTRKLNVVYDLAGLLAYSLLSTFPLMWLKTIINSGMEIQQVNGEL